ncbi:hypothetical protein VMCG_08958 [Cytospora schulzeri]|uniref:Uncharacterized protein n=1 Tax=Cytospora schulzeri TaxID=448051 RepID=A0A423VNI4_9PEZI|nr:hypothetical protein VMCG_08958 [Valsa malicola]
MADSDLCGLCLVGLFEVTFRLILYIITSIAIALIGELIAAHQHSIIQRSRQIQNLLCLPKCMHIFSEADTEINQDDIKVSAVILFFMALITSAGALSAVVEGTATFLDNLWVLGLSMGVPSSLGLALWLWLALSCRRRTKNRRDVAWDTEDAVIENSGMKRAVRDDDEKIILLSEQGKTKSIEIIGPDKIHGWQKELPKPEVKRDGRPSQHNGNGMAYKMRVSWDDADFPFMYYF